MIAHDIRSAHNVGSLLRTADGYGVKRVYLTGYTPFPAHAKDDRLPHLSAKLTKQISKTALGAETNTNLWKQHTDVKKLINKLHADDFSIFALEQTNSSMKLPGFDPPEKVAILLGREVEGVDTELLELCDKVLEIPMYGKKESFNVIEAATAAIYHCRFHPF